MTRLGRQVIAAVFSVLFISPAIAEESAPAAPSAYYVEFDEPLVVNFGESANRLKYLKATITLRAATADGATLVKHHSPQIRNNLVLLFSKQKEEDIKTIEGREKLRKAALEEVQKVLTEEEGQPHVTNLLMPSFVIQD
ncbi:flagellar basal body-associated FliL family protein [Balneatrix alpica]|uniref:flagellar basal body-associated FliL family protein n=1 Tax=Balneatrix alpica TaxID=75684 RepID=UPI002738B4B9|nr:flagellar basal body-associated FliL family protein [Balneatrix alpica]